MGISVETKHGNIVISGDLKLEHEDGIPSQKEQDVFWGRVGKDKNILFIGDSQTPSATVSQYPKDVYTQTLKILCVMCADDLSSEHSHHSLSV